MHILHMKNAIQHLFHVHCGRGGAILRLSLCRHHTFVVSFFSCVHTDVGVSPGSCQTAVVTEDVSIVACFFVLVGGGAEK